MSTFPAFHMKFFHAMEMVSMHTAINWRHLLQLQALPGLRNISMLVALTSPTWHQLRSYSSVCTCICMHAAASLHKYMHIV